jgi:hypothetical protein
VQYLAQASLWLAGGCNDVFPLAMHPQARAHSRDQPLLPNSACPADTDKQARAEAPAVRRHNSLTRLAGPLAISWLRDKPDDWRRRGRDVS